MKKEFTKMWNKTIFIFIVLFLIKSGFATAQPAPPDYSDLKYWAASPHKTDASDQIPVFLKDEKREILADVFFIHPTIYDINLFWMNIRENVKLRIDSWVKANGSKK